MAYPIPKYGIPEITPSPQGYVPFHMEHYGRHGSRWLIRSADYTEPVRALQKANEYGKLTPRGVELLSLLEKIEIDSRGRLGELTPLGHRQHRDIANRMVNNFPEIFTDSTYVDAKSTIVIRCILSMANEIAELQRQIPSIRVKMDASRTTQDTLAYNSLDSVANNLIDSAIHIRREYARTLHNPDKFLSKVFNDSRFVTDSLDGQDVFDRVFYIAVNMQSHDDYPEIYDLFTEEELTNGWLERNADWYITSGNNPMTNHRVPYNQRHLLKNIIESADTALTSKNISANLRFGHESILLPLSVLMEINNAAYSTDDITSLADHWRAYEIFPMASNIQIIFYRPENSEDYTPDDILVKILLNEKEATMPAEAVSWPYYRWNDLKKYYTEKLNKIPE